MTDKFAFIFPGQGSQSPGMLESLAGEKVVQDTLKEADGVLGFAISELIANGPADRLSLTVNTQPALLTTSVAMYRFYREQGGRQPDYMAGHSLGEYSALCCAGALAFADALRLVRARALLMESAVPAGVGAMAAVLGLSDEDVKAVCQKAAQGGKVCEAVNFNTPGQVVIAGHAEAVKAAGDLAAEAGARRVVPLAVSGPFHSTLMQPAADGLREPLNESNIAKPVVPVIHNADVKTHDTPEEIRHILALQAASPVLWSQTILELESLGVRRLYECGPGAALTGMVKRITRALSAKALNSRDALAAAATENKE